MFQKIKELFLHHKTSKKEKVISGFIAFAYIVLAGRFGQSGMQSEWFQGLIKPGAQPPDWVFGLVWSILFVLLGAAGYYVWNLYESDRGRKLFAGLYFLNGLLLAAWSDQFVLRHNMDNGLLILIFVLVVTEVMMVTAIHTSRKAAYLLAPYLAWIIFATYLNADYIILN